MASEDDDAGPSRREMLIGAAATGAGLIAGAALGAAGRREGPTTTAAPSPATLPTVAATLTINGRPHALDVEPRTTLLDLLREDLGLCGTKKGCDHGQCGACTVLVDGRRELACLSLAVMLDGKSVKTVEGLSDGETLHPVQQAFLDHDAFQCGYCTSGQICSAVGLIGEGHARTDDDIREGMSGNLCRCAVYPNIVAAVRQAMDQQAKG